MAAVNESVRQDGRQREIALRLAALDRRIKELEVRRRQLNAVLPRRGSSATEVSAARAWERTARKEMAKSVQAVLRALERSAMAHERAAVAHEAAASAHERVAGSGTGEVEEHRLTAAEHRAAAELDRSIVSHSRGADSPGC